MSKTHLKVAMRRKRLDGSLIEQMMPPNNTRLYEEELPYLGGVQQGAGNHEKGDYWPVLLMEGG